MPLVLLQLTFVTFSLHPVFLLEELAPSKCPDSQESMLSYCPKIIIGYGLNETYLHNFVQGDSTYPHAVTSPK